MVQKYTILKALIRTSNKGFTLIELLVGLSITLLIGSFAMNAFIQASAMYSKDKKDIDNSQNLSAVLEMIGNDIKQAGEQISMTNFPVIDIKQNNGTTTSDSSTIVIRRAVTTPLNLCDPVAANASPTRLIVADSAKTGNCAPFQTPTPPTSATTPNPILPKPLRNTRDYRCKQDDPNFDYSNPLQDYCNGPDNPKEIVRAILVNQTGNTRTFDYKGESTVGTQYAIDINNISTDPTNAYSEDSAIYIIEERTYKLNADGNLTMKRDSEPESILIKGLAKFKISAKLYSDTTTKAIDTNPDNGCSTNIQYACKFSPTDTPTYDWRKIAGVKVELQAQYDPSGNAPTPSSADKEKLSAEAEFFPRNVMSR